MQQKTDLGHPLFIPPRHLSRYGIGNQFGSNTNTINITCRYPVQAISDDRHVV